MTRRTRPGTPHQPSLFGDDSPDEARVGTVPIAAEVAALAGFLRPSLRLGTSSWAFPGWAGIVYDRAHGESRLAREGLAAYARHPLLRTVGLDRGYYAPLPRRDLAGYRAAVPSDFRFLVKAPGDVLFPSVQAPDPASAGTKRWQPNPAFLDPARALDLFVGPCCEELGAACGPLLFQFAPGLARRRGLAESFPDRLHAFLGALPRGPLYAVEIRDAALLTRAYGEALRDGGAVHAYVVHPSMPPLPDQALVLPPASQPALVVRWMLGHGQAYDEARERYAPFDRIVDEDPRSRSEIAQLVRTIIDDRPIYVVANNKAEGSSPLSLLELARLLAAP